MNELSQPQESVVAHSTLQRPSLKLTVDLMHGDITDVEAPIAVCAHQEGVPLVGDAHSFDRLLKSWLTQAIEFQMISARLGQLFFVNLARIKPVPAIRINELVLVGLGEPGQLSPDDVQFLISNITTAVKKMGFSVFATNLIGTRRRELSILEAARSVVDGILDSHRRLEALSPSSRREQNFIYNSENSFRIMVVDNDKQKLIKMRNAFINASDSRDIVISVNESTIQTRNINITTTSDELSDNSIATILRVTRRKQPEGSSGEILEFSAVSETATVAVRESSINTYLHENLPKKLIETIELQFRESFCRFFFAAVIPDDFKKIVERAASLTIEVDETTALYPWEMMAQSRYGRTTFAGTTICVSRQFRTQLAPPPAAPPPLSTKLRVLLIADPAPYSLALPGAREEGWAVIDVLNLARKLWEEIYEIEVTVRIGSETDDSEGLNDRLKVIREMRPLIVSAEKCNPLEVNMQIATEQFDVIHYAGHGFFDKKREQAGWVLDQKCWLSAEDMFRVRQVPRLVFANACFSAVTLSDSPASSGHEDPRKDFVSVAMAFFRRGIPNFVGTGWKVDDAVAKICSQYFYALALGLQRPDARQLPIKPELMTIAAALRDARIETMRFDKKSSTWGAYQHYGRVSDRLLAPAPEGSTF